MLFDGITKSHRKRRFKHLVSAIRRSLLLGLVFTLFLDMGGGALPAHASAGPPVQECFNAANSNPTSITCTMSLSVTAGDVIVCGLGLGIAVRGTVEDTLTTLYTIRNANITSGGSDSFIGAQFTGTASQSGSDVITVFFASTPGAALIDCAELTGVYEYGIGITSAIGSASGGGTFSLTLGSPFTPIPNSFVYVYALADPCSGTSTIVYNAGFTSLSANSAVGASGSTCRIIGAHKFQGSQAAMYEIWGASGSTSATMSWSMNTSIGQGTGVWMELLIELSTTPPPTPSTPPVNPIHGSSRLGSGVVFSAASYGNPGQAYNTQAVLQADLNMLYATGAQCIRVDINFQWWLQSNTAIINELTSVIQGIQASGHCLIIADAGSESYRHGGAIPWTQFQLAWATRVRTLAALFHPNYYIVIKEPGWYAPMVSDALSNPQFQNFTQWSVLTQNLTGTVLLVSPSTKVGVSIGAHSLVTNGPAYTLYLGDVVQQSQLSFIGFDIYTLGDQQSTQTYLNTYGTGGKSVWIPEWWSTTDGSNSGNDPQAITNIFGFAQQNGVQMLIPFYTNDFSAYNISSITDSPTLISTYSNDRTPVFFTYQGLLTAPQSCNTVNNAELTAFNAFQLFGIMLIAMGAVAIIGLVLMMSEGGSVFASTGDGDQGGNFIQLGIDENMAKVLGVVLASMMVIVGMYVFAAFGTSTNAVMGC